MGETIEELIARQVQAQVEIMRKRMVRDFEIKLQVFHAEAEAEMVRRDHSLLTSLGLNKLMLKEDLQAVLAHSMVLERRVSFQEEASLQPTVHEEPLVREGVTKTKCSNHCL